ncbi:MAG: maltokinase N-terminal cap-like domain-containing protein [Acidimicrobiales bacterium]
MTTELHRTLPELVAEHLPAHLLRQRWSGAHNRAVESVELRWHELVREESPHLLWALAHVRFTDGVAQDYQVFVGVRPVDPQPDFLQGKELELLAVVPDPDGPDGAALVLYDALVDPDLAIEVLHLVAPEVEVEVRRPIVLEHSNSSIVYDESSILKIFRKVEPGPNPDVEITRVLAEQGYPHVLAPLAELRRDGTDLAVLREYLVGATEGWALARTSVRDLLASRMPPEECGGDFGPDAERLGHILGGLHLAMAEAWGHEAGDPAGWAQEMEDHLAEVLQTAADDLDAPALRARYAELAALTDAGRQIRIHGDLHLAQLVMTDAGWYVLDFEGEPDRRRDERYTTSSPLRDVAGMLRSLQYAAAVGRSDWSVDDAQLDALAGAWDDRARAAFMTGYLGTEGIEALLPGDPQALRTALVAFELDKAVYEVGYERGHRPELVDVPLSGIARLLAEPTPH